MVYVNMILKSLCIVKFLVFCAKHPVFFFPYHCLYIIVSDNLFSYKCLSVILMYYLKLYYSVSGITTILQLCLKIIHYMITLFRICMLGISVCYSHLYATILLCMLSQMTWIYQ